MYFTEEQSCSYLDSTVCPVLLLTGERGWPYRKSMMEDREKRLKQGLPFFDSYHYENGGHHLHLESETADDVANRIVHFLRKCSDRDTKL